MKHRASYEPAGFCPNCGYHTDAGICAECGFDIQPHQLRSAPASLWWMRAWRLGWRLAVGLVLLLVVLTLVYRWWYYREFYGVMAEIQRLPNVTRVSGVANEDVTLEEFTVHFMVDGRIPVSWYFPEEPSDRVELLRSSMRSSPGLVLQTPSGKFSYGLGVGSRLETMVGSPLRGGRDVLSNLTRILELVESGALGSEPTPNGRNVVYLTIQPAK